jgi:poly(3-hydroxybutyrate) depolymerase
VRPRFALVVGLLSGLIAATIGAADAKKETFGSGGRNRTYYLYVPDSAKAKAPVPLIVLLHGSGRNGKTLTDHWEALAKKEGFIIAAPDALTPEAWRIPEDGPDFLYDLVELLTTQHEAIDRRRVYLFGHSAGAIHSLVMGLLESEYFAAVAVHAGALAQGNYPAIDSAVRKIPMAIWVGTNDPFFPLAAVRATRDVLNARGFKTELTEIHGHTHNYYGRASDINRKVWEFLQTSRLDADPKYQRYAIP